MSFLVQPGQTLAVVGGTGEGKTTLLNLIMRFADPEEGAVRLGGVDVRSCSLDSVRAEVSIAPQRPMLFQGTIRSNLLMARPDATEEDLWEALHIAAADEFVRALPEGLDAVVDKAGGNFSGGQKQRLSIARALVKHASVYLFDDALSALDFKTEAVVRARLAPRVADAVCVVVSQRASAVLDADAIAVLDDGALVGFGRHEELIDGCDVYREIMHTQIQEEVAA
ncbi:ABC transporter ATP-binding protein [Eggerthella sinensis]|uniref:ABC transporter ATP-binding protein n=1 Tax=Eggerthella sinensis TaxID=242230 RepID=UPI0022E9089F|nr:ABC transporter ATP-binding protein [Eggerthella sinensis]